MKQKNPIMNWLNRYLGRPEILVLLAGLIVADLVFLFFGKMLAPVFASIVIAYLLQWPINKLESLKVPHIFSVFIVYFIFLGLVIIGIVGLLPLLWRQLNNLFLQLPAMVNHAQTVFMQLPYRYPGYISADEIQQILDTLKTETLAYGQRIVSLSLSSLTSAVMLSVYLVLVPLLVYFFLMDKTRLLNMLKNYLPRRRQLLAKVWLEVYEQIGRYVRGKAFECLIVAIVFYLQFKIMGLNYATLLAVLVGLSVIIPYIGAVIVTVPVLVIAFLQWDFSTYFSYFVLIYAVLIALDANVLVPLLFAEAVDLHPVSIILAVLVFGGLFGFWGVFFAIPLASLVKAVMHVLSDNNSLRGMRLR